MASDFLKNKAKKQKEEYREKYNAAVKQREARTQSKGLMANNPGYVYSKTYGDGTTGAAANKVIKGAASAKDAIAASNDAITRNNPAYSYLQREGATTVTRGSDAITENPSSVEWYKKILRGMDTGLTSFGQSLTSLADVVTSLGDESGGPLQELWYMFSGDRIMQDNPVKALNKLGQSEVDYRSRHNASMQDDPFYKYSAMLGETIPMLIPSIMTGGATAFGEAAGTASELAAASKVGQTASNLGKTYELAKNSLKNLASRPDAQTIFGSVLGSSYDEAKQDGADDGQALTYAILNGVANTVTELGGADTALGGLQNLPSWLKNAIEKGDKSLLLNYAKSVGEEVSEELIQGILGRGFKSLYSDVPLYDPNNENSIINPEAAIDEATGAAVVTTLLGLPTVGINAQRRARQNRSAKEIYGNSQQELVNEGLQSEQGSESYELAQKYNEKLSEGKKLSGNELYKLAKANEDAITQEQTVQSAAPIETNTPEIDIPEITGTAARSDIPYAAMQQNAPITAQTYNAPVNFGGIQQSAQIQSSVENLSAKYNVSDELIGRVYNLNPTAPQAFETAFDAVYQMGQQGTDKAALSKVPVLNMAQANIAYQMGADSVKNVSTDTATQAATPVQTAAPVTINNTQEVSEDGIRIRDGGEWINGQNTEGQIRGVETWAGENQVRTAQAQPGRSQPAQIKTGEKVSYKGKQQKGVYYAAEDTEDMKKGRKLAESYGYKVMYFVGGNIRYAGGEFRGVVDTANKTVMVRADHPDYTADQIMRHEMGHAAFENGDLSIGEAKELLLEDFPEKELNDMALKYAEAFTMDDGELVMSIDEAFEEICCDALGRMNIFKNTTYDSESYGKAQDTVRKYAAERTGSKGRSPPKKGGVKYSKEVPAIDLSDISTLSKRIGNVTGAKRYNIIRDFIMDELSQQPIVLSDGRKAVVDKSDALHIANKSRSKKTAEIAQIRKIVETAQLVAEETSTKNGKFKHFYYYEASVRYRGETFNVYLNVGVARNDATNHIYDITQNLRDTAQPVAVGRLSKSFALRSGISDKSIHSSSENVNEKFSREPERLNELRRQNERKLAQATAEDAANENERGLIRDYQKQYSKVEDIREKLSAAQQTLTEAEDSGADYDTTTKAKNRFTLLSKQYAREHRKLNGYGSTKALQNVLERVSARTSKDAEHIDNRNFSNMGDRSLKPFQMEHPELHKYYEDMAQTVLYDIGMATQFRTTNGYPKTKFTDGFKRALGGSSFNDGLQALLDISNDQGSENYALAKRMELFLDDLLTNGYKGASGNAEYIRAKENISGGNTVWENFLEENSLAIADGLITEKELYKEFTQMRSDLPEGMGAASANFTGEETVGERWVTEAQGEGDSALHPISKEQEANLAEQQRRAPQEIPKKDLNGKLTSKHVSTIANSGMTPAEFSDALREDAAQGKFSHIAYSDEEALKKAERAIEVDGWDQALASYKAEINSGRVSKDNTVMGIALYNNAVNSGDYATAMDIASLMVKNSTNTAQSLQAMRILNKLSPECRLYLAAKSIENIEEDLNERYKDNKADIHVDKILYDEYAKALRQGDEDGIKTAWANIEQSVAQQIDATWYEKLNNFRYLAMLGNPRTHVRNIVGNAFFVPVRAVKNTIAYGLENIADAKINGGIERSKAILNPNNAADAALVKYAMSDYEAVQEVILSGGKYVDTFQGIDKHRTIYKTKILEAARKGNSAALDAEDAWFCKPAYANALAKWYKANGISAEQLNTGKVPEETIIKAQTTAIKEAQKATYRDTNWFSAQVSRLGKVDNKVAAVLIEGVLPFKKTPANILARAVEYSPVGLIKSLALDTKKVKAYVNGDVENGMSPAQFIDDISAGLTGSALMGLGILLASWGVLSGGDDDDEKQNYFDELSGKQNYALSIGGVSITLDWLAPESMPLFVGVELFNSLSSKNEDNGFLQNLMSSVMSLSTPMFEMSMLQSVNDLFDNLAYIKQGQGTFKIVSSMAANYISQYFPTLFGQIERSFEETQRETTYIDRNSNVGSELQYMWGKIANKIPFYDFSQIPYIDAWGRTEETGNLFERMLNNFVNPAYVKKERPTEIDGELERLYDLGETSVYPGRAKTNTKINGEYLTADEYVKYATTKGQTSYELAQGVINSAAYSGASDPEKAYMLKYVYSYADHIAKYEVNNDYSLAKWEMAAYKSANPMQAIIDHAREYYNPDKEN